jgi:cell division septum initiation protein DivIVA
VSAFEPQLPTDPKVDMPDFMVVLRGFDRRQVEMWAAEVAHQIEQERQRADEAEKRAYRVQIENKGAPSFSHLGTHVASILEEAGKSSENMLADAAERAQETVDAAEEEAAEIIKAAEHRAGEIEGEARRTLEEASSEGARVEEEALQAAEEMRAQAEQDARTVLEEARDATDMIWQEAERERLGVEAETIRLETLRHRSLEQLGRVYGHLESVLDEVRAGIGRVEEETEDLDEATAAAAARLGVEPPASSPEESPRFPAPRDARPPEGEDDGDGLELRDSDDGDGLELRDSDDGGDGMLAATRPDTPPAPEDAEATQPVPASGTAETTQPTLPGSAAETTQPDPAVAAAETPGGDDEGPAGDQDATQRLEPVGNAANNKARSARPGAAKDDKGQP